MLLTDHMALDATGAKTTREGFMVAQVKIARTGIQEYRAGEIGMTDRSANDVVRIYRPADQVFAKDSLHSFSNIDLTINHPKGMVDSKNWRDLAAGNTGEGVLRDGEFLSVPIILKDQTAIDAVKAGKRELSVGYTCDLDMTPGQTPSGEAYDGVQTNIRANHLALCDTARGGPELRIPDSKEPTMTLKTILVDGLSVETTDAAEKAIVKLQGQVVAVTSAKDTADADNIKLKAEAVAKDAEIVALKQKVEDSKLSPAQLRDAAKAYGLTIAKAKAAGATVTDAMSELDIKKAVVTAKMGDAAKAYTDEHIAIAFDALTKDLKIDASKTPDAFRDAVIDGGLDVTDETKTYDAAKQARLDRLNRVSKAA
jgi:hypothetical protein